MNIPLPLIAAFPPSADLLLNRARRNIDDAMLKEIAKADYGHMANEMLIELRALRDKGVIPTPMNGQLDEVLSLTRWNDPQDPKLLISNPGLWGQRGHQIRLFACAVLLRAAAEPTNIYSDRVEDSSLAQCLVSAKALDEGMSEAVGSFLTWQLSQDEHPNEPVLFALGLLICAVRLGPGRIADHALGNIAEWVLAEEALQRNAFKCDPAEPPPAAFSLLYGYWKPLAAEIQNRALSTPITDVRTNLELCVAYLEMH